MADVKLVVIVSGGLIQKILSNAPVEALILDCDTEGFDRLREIRDWNFEQKAPSEETVGVFDTLPFDALVDPPAVEHFFNEMAKEMPYIPTLPEAYGILSGKSAGEHGT